MFKSKRGFTLIELLAVIVILAIIVVIATTSVGGAISQSRAKSFVETMEVAVKNAKNVIAQDGTLEDGTLKASMDYKEGEYDFSVEKYDNGYKITLTPGNGRFKNLDFSKLSEAEKEATGFVYGKNTITAYININGKLVSEDSIGDKIADSGDTGGGESTGDNTGDGGDNTGGGGETPPPGPEPDVKKEKIGEDSGKCVAMEKKSTYIVGDTIYICNSSNAKSNDKEEFYVLSSFTDTESNVRKYKLISLYGINGTGTQTDANTVFSMKYAINTNEIKHMVNKAKDYAIYISGLLNKAGISGTIADATDIISSFSTGSREYYSYTYYTTSNDSNDFTRVLPLSSDYLACSDLIKTDSGYKYKYIKKDGNANEFRSVSAPIGNDVYAQIRPTIIVPADVIEKES